MPTVSVIVPSYNHEKYIAETIKSVLDQTFQDFELIITDNGSTDDNVVEIKKFNDPRIKLYYFSENKGAAVAINHCISHATGKYIALLCSDDMFMPDKLEKQVNYLEAHPEIGIVFSRAALIDEQGNPFQKKDHFYIDVFNKKNRSRHEWLNHFFYQGNCLCHPSALMRKAVCENIGQYNPCYAQLPDFDFWIRAAFEYEFYIFEEQLVKFRIRDNEMNTSGDTPENRIRGEWEHRRIFKHFFDIQSLDELLKIFPDLKNKYDDFIESLIPYYVALLCLETNAAMRIFPAIEALACLLETSADLLLEKVNFSCPDFFNLVVSADIFGYQTKALQHELNSKNEEIQLLLNSLSWKVSKPLRWVKNKIMR